MYTFYLQKWLTFYGVYWVVAGIGDYYHNSTMRCWPRLEFVDQELRFKQTWLVLYLIYRRTYIMYGLTICDFK